MRAARQELGQELVAALTQAIGRDGPVEAISTCQQMAGPLGTYVAGEYDVEIGRTSHRLRNPNNAPPPWAVPYVQAEWAEPVTLRHEASGRLAELAPITMAPLCVQCHGPADQLAPGVGDALAELYPNDAATGFNAGDLRGWFVVAQVESTD